MPTCNQEFILRKCRKVAYCCVSYYSCWNNKPSSGVYKLIRILKNRRYFREGLLELLKWKLPHGIHGTNYLGHWRQVKNYLSTYLENRNSVITGSLISQIKVWHSEGSKGLLSLISKGQGFLFHCSGRDKVRIKNDRIEIPSVLVSWRLPFLMMPDDFHAWDSLL